jgi:hypothetical protein
LKGAGFMALACSNKNAVLRYQRDAALKYEAAACASQNPSNIQVGIRGRISAFSAI